MYRSLLLATALAAGGTVPAHSQDAPATAAASALPDPNDPRDTLTIGVGGAILPDYEGSNDDRAIPAVAIRARVHGISVFSRATYLYADLIPRRPGKLDFDAGPIAGFRKNLSGKIKDPVVGRIARRKTAIEVGGFVGLTYHGLTNPYDALSLRVDAVKDVGGAHRSSVITPTIDFGTPLSTRTYVGLTASTDIVGDGYADRYFSIDAADALATGLPLYSARGGVKNWKVALLANQALTGNLLHGLSLFGTASYSRLTGEFKRAPIVAIRGSASQWLGAAGLAFTF